MVTDGTRAHGHRTERANLELTRSTWECSATITRPTWQCAATIRYRLSRQRLIHHLQAHPELCDAAIGYWCCEAGDAAKAVIEARVRADKRADSARLLFGVFGLVAYAPFVSFR